MNKYCPDCKLIKDSSDFHKNKHRKDGLYQYCKSCTRKQRIDKKSEIAAYMKQYKIDNKQKLSNYMKQYKEDNRKQITENYRIWNNDYRKNNINARIKHNLGTRINKAVKNNSKSAHTLQLLGCTVNELKEHLQKQFDNNMNWNNYGSYWHIDHIIPCTRFDLSDSSQQKECFNYMNLQPLEAIENIKKSNR